MGEQEIPAVDGWPLIGNLPSILRDPICFAERVGERGDVVRLRRVHHEFYYVDHPELLQRVLIDEPEKFRKSSFVGQALDGVAPSALVATKGDRWRRLRGVLQPTFAAQKIPGYTNQIVEEVEGQLEEWDSKECIEAVSMMKNLGLRTTCNVLFESDARRLADSLSTVAEVMEDRLESATRFLPAWLPTPMEYRLERAVTDYEDTIEAIIRRRRSSPTPREDFFGQLISALEEGGLSERELSDQLFTVLFPAYENVGVTLAFALFSLACSSTVQQRFHEELEEVPGLGKVEEYPVTEAIIKETLRLYPPSFEILKETTEDVTLAGYRIPEESQIIVPILQVHRDSRWWDAPDDFRPDRWLSGEPAAPESAYLPFSGGARACLGREFAMTQLVLSLATIGSRYRFDLASDQSSSIDLTLTTTLQPSGPVNLIAESRGSCRDYR